MDAACKVNDTFYNDHENTKERHTADKELENIGNEWMHASDASIREKPAAAMVKTVMKPKRFLGMGFKY